MILKKIMASKLQNIWLMSLSSFTKILVFQTRVHTWYWYFKPIIETSASGSAECKGWGNNFLTVLLFVYIRRRHEYHSKLDWLGTLRSKSHWFWREKWLQRRSHRRYHSLLRAIHSGNGCGRRGLHPDDRFGSSIYGRKRQRQGVTYVRGYIRSLRNFRWVKLLW